MDSFQCHFPHQQGTLRVTKECFIPPGSGCAVVIKNEDTPVCVFIFLSTHVKDAQDLP